MVAPTFPRSVDTFVSRVYRPRRRFQCVYGPAPEFWHVLLEDGLISIVEGFFSVIEAVKAVWYARAMREAPARTMPDVTRAHVPRVCLYLTSRLRPVKVLFVLDRHHPSIPPMPHLLPSRPGSPPRSTRLPSITASRPDALQDSTPCQETWRALLY
jgi:hypothetical protein